MKELDVKKLKLAQVRYFDTLHNGVEIPPIEAYVFLQQIGDFYFNPFTMEEGYPVYDRVPYTNTTRDGEDYGTKIILVSGECQEGPCYVMEKVDMEPVFLANSISMEQLENYVIHSKLFFVDRMDLLKKKGATILNKKLREDRKKFDLLQEYMDRGRQYQR